MDRNNYKVITLDEFFKLKEMFQGLPDDQEMAWEISFNLKNSSNVITL